MSYVRAAESEQSVLWVGRGILAEVEVELQEPRFTEAMRL